MTGLEVVDGPSQVPEEDWREAIVRHRFEQGFTFGGGIIIEPDLHVRRTNETWGETYEHEGEEFYASEDERRLAVANRDLMAWITQDYRPEDVAVELVPPALEEYVRRLYPSTYPLSNYRLVLLRQSQAPESQAA